MDAVDDKFCGVSINIPDIIFYMFLHDAVINNDDKMVNCIIAKSKISFDSIWRCFDYAAKNSKPIGAFIGSIKRYQTDPLNRKSLICQFMGLFGNLCNDNQLGQIKILISTMDQEKILAEYLYTFVEHIINCAKMNGFMEIVNYCTTLTST